MRMASWHLSKFQAIALAVLVEGIVLTQQAGVGPCWSRTKEHERVESSSTCHLIIAELIGERWDPD